MGGVDAVWVLAASVAVATALLTALAFDRYTRWRMRRTGLEVFFVAMQDDLPELYALLEAVYRRSRQGSRFVSVSLEEREELRDHARGLFGRTKPFFHLLRPKTIAAILEVRRLFGSLDQEEDKVRSEDVLNAKLRLQVLAEDIGLVESAAGDKYVLVAKR